MLKNYFKSGLRNLLKNRWISFVNIAGLTVGMASAMLIFLFVQHQLRYDKNQPKAESIYRIETTDWVLLPAYVGDAASEFPEVQNLIRLYFGQQPTLKYQENSITPTKFAWADSSIFRTFKFEVVSGDLSDALARPRSIVLTESKSKSLFGTEHPIGKTINLDQEYSYIVSAVIRDLDHFHMPLDGFAAITDLTDRPSSKNLLKGPNYNFTIYIEALKGTDPKVLSQKIKSSAMKLDYPEEDRILLRPFDEIYFTKNLQHERNTKHGNFSLIIVFSLVGALLLFVACINFINLTIARTKIRQKEVAIRKVIGAKPLSVRAQFFIESGMITSLAFLIGMILVSFVLSDFSTLIGETLVFKLDTGVILLASGVLIFTLICSALYPAILLSGAVPVLSLNGRNAPSGEKSTLSKVLLTVQYAVSVFLIIAAILVLKQLSFMQKKELGIDHSQVISFMMKGARFSGSGEPIMNQKRLFEERLKSITGIKGITFLNQLPGNITNTSTMCVNNKDDSKPMKVLNADPSAIPVLDIEVVSGRNLSYDLKTDFGYKILINEEAVRQFKLDNPIGTVFSGNMEVVGVMKDFHYNSLHSRIAPLAVSWNSWTKSACLKLTGVDFRETIQNVRELYEEFCPGFAFEFQFLDQSFARQYEEEQRLGSLLWLFAGITIFLSCMGLFTLTAFMAERRSKEIGIRKVLGASSSDVIRILSSEFLMSVLLANLIAWPVAYYLLKDWLTGFDYRTDIAWWVFVVGTLVALLVAILSIGLRALKAVRKSPVCLLRSD